MIDQQLYIDGILMDLDDNTKIVLNIKSNLFRDVTKMTANNTYTIQLPKTMHNLSVLEHADKPKADTEYPYIFHSCRYFRNGLEIIKEGRLNVMSVTETINAAIYWGLFPAFSALQENNTKLNELGSGNYMKFDLRNTPCTKEEACNKGIFYAYYNPYQIDEQEDSFTVAYTKNTPTTSEQLVLKTGRIKTGTTVGAYVDGLVQDDSDWKCIIVRFYPTMIAYINAYGEGDYRAYAVLDRNMKVVELADEPSSYGIKEFGVAASSRAAYLIINIPSSLENDAQNMVRGAKNMRELSDIMNSVEDFTGDDIATGNSDKDIPKYLQPCVTANWILVNIKHKTGVEFRWNGAAERFIDTLVIPIVNNKADSNTIQGRMDASINETSQLGVLSFDIINTVSSIKEKTGEGLSEITVQSSCELHFDLQARIKNKFSGEGYGIDMIHYFTIEVVSTSEGKETKTEYTLSKGAMYDNGDARFYVWKKSDMIGGAMYDVIGASIDIKLQQYDKVAFNIARSPLVSSGFSVYGGTITATYKVGEEVPVGGRFPIDCNLPDMEVLSFIKFLSLVTGTFPLQISDSSRVKFASYEDVFNNRKNAIDWSGMLIPLEWRNTPRQMEFSLSDYKQHNRYKWKEDEQTHMDNDADLKVYNRTLDYEQDMWTLPFAASDGNRIPIRTEDKYGDSGGGEYKGCKDRIMTFADKEQAALEFGIDLQGIFDTKYKRLAASLSKAHIITEWMNLTDLDLLSFDESKPVYLAQYGAYFAVLELKASDNGYTEAKMMQLEF